MTRAAGAEVAVRNAAVLAGLGEPGPALRRWQWIVVHHTAAEYATLPGIDRYHRKRFGDPLGAEYHFVINNGKKERASRPVGLIDVARWNYQEPAWHLFKPDNAPDSIAICLVGNFETRAVPAEMLTALTELTRALMRLCEIPRERVSTHRVVDEKLTQCPGKLFPREAFLRGL
jgi:N-acetyl-anhydromuramyl-L-alanine amidase AmpD